MPAIRTYTVTRVQTVEVTTAHGYEEAQRLGLASLDGNLVRTGGVYADPKERPDGPHGTTREPKTTSVRVDLG